MIDTPKEDVYDNQISPLMAQIIQICKDNNIGMAASFELDPHPHNEDDFLHCSTTLPGAEGELVPSLIRMINKFRSGSPVRMSAIVSRDRDGNETRTMVAHVDD